VKVSKKYKKQFKKRILTTLGSVAVVFCVLAGSKLMGVSMNLDQIIDKAIKQELQILTPTEKPKEVEDFASSSKLNNIYIGESRIQGFTSEKLNYEVILENKISQINVSVDKQDERQEVTGVGDITLTGETQVIEISVVSADSTSTSTYTITISYKENVSQAQKVNTYEFEYTGEEQRFIAPYTGYYKMELWGAQGGTASGVGGKGAYTSGNVYLEKDQKLYVYVGQTGTGLLTVTYNGGGAAGTAYTTRSGGGSTDIRLSSGDWDNFDSLKSRIMVAAGGGGSVGPSYTCNGGVGRSTYWL